MLHPLPRAIYWGKATCHSVCVCALIKETEFIPDGEEIYIKVTFDTRKFAAQISVIISL
jgi:hypothetical protein